MKPDIKGKLAVVTGASGGIGLEFCKVLAEKGAHLLMISIDDEPLHQAAAMIARDYNVETYPLTLDLCLPDAPDRIFAFMENFSLTPYILINNAGIFSFSPALEIPERKIQTFIDLHVSAATSLSLRFASLFIKLGQRSNCDAMPAVCDSSNNHGNSPRSDSYNEARHSISAKALPCGYILNMSSMSCWMPMPGITMYSATKAYIRVFTRALAYEMRDHNVKVMAACPGGIATDLFGLPDNLKRLAVRIGAIARPDDFARKAIDRMLRGKMQYINGPINRLAIFFVGILPTPLRMQIKRRLLDRGITKK